MGQKANSADRLDAVDGALIIGKRDHRLVGRQRTLAHAA